MGDTIVLAAQIAAILSVPVAILLWLFPSERYSSVARRHLPMILGLCGFVLFLLLAFIASPWWGLGSAAIAVVVCVGRRKPLLSRLRATGARLAGWWYNSRIRRRLPRIIGEVLTRGHSPLLKEIDPKRHDAHDGKHGLPYESFLYCPAKLRHDRPAGVEGNRLDHMRPTNDGGLAALGESAVEGDGSQRCRIYGPYVRLASSGVYLVSFRIRCRDEVGGQSVTGCEVEADVTHHKGTLYPGHFPIRVTLRPGNYASLPLLFAYREEPEVEFRLPAKGDPAAAIVIDVICVLRIGDVGEPNR